MPIEEKIKYIEKIVPDAYHGTTLHRAKKIIREKKFRPSRNSECYLGDGVYFYEASKWHAEEWCKRKYPGQIFGIICACLNLGKCLDLNNYEHRRLVKMVALQLSMRGYTLTDAFVINYYATNIENFDTVRASYFSESKDYGKIFSGSKFSEFSQLIICVRNNNCVLTYRLISEEESDDGREH